MRYFFHLSFGDRLLPDEDGIELTSRAAARREALAVVRDLSDRVADRWAGWFLQVADRHGQFLSLPIGHPALELVSDRAPQRRSSTGSAEELSGLGRADLHERAAALFEQALALREHTARLLERNRQLKSEVSSQFLFNRAVGDRARQLISHARLATSSEPQIHRSAEQPAHPASPHLVVLPGGKLRPAPG
jgi:hypothetical protein